MGVETDPQPKSNCAYQYTQLVTAHPRFPNIFLSPLSFCPLYPTETSERQKHENAAMAR